MSKIESDKMTLNLNQASLWEVVDGIAFICQLQVRDKRQQFDVFIHDISAKNVACDSVRLVQQFVLKFLDDGSYALLRSSLETGDQKAAFRVAHTIKGVCTDLVFIDLWPPAGRSPMPCGSEPSQLGEEDYRRTVQTIRAFREGTAG